MPSQAFAAATGAAATGCAACVDLLKVEILRDFAQNVSLFLNELFSGISSGVSAALTATIRFFGLIYNFLTVDLANALNSDLGRTITVIVAVVGVILSLVTKSGWLYELLAH